MSRMFNANGADHIFSSKRIFNNMGMLRITVKGNRQSESCIFQIKILVHNALEMRWLSATVGSRLKIRAPPSPFRYVRKSSAA